MTGFGLLPILIVAKELGSKGRLRPQRHIPDIQTCHTE